MALNKNTQTPAFEDPDGDVVSETAQPSAKERLAAAAAERAAAEAKAAGTAVANKPAGAVAKHQPMINPFEGLQNAFPVKFNTLTQIQANQGNFIHKDTGKLLGDTIVLELLSTQVHHVLSPGSDDDASLQYVKYSSDGVTSDDGIDMQEALRHAKAAGYDKAKITERMYLVGCLADAGKVPDLAGSMVQVDLAPSSVAHWKRHELGTAFAISKGKADADGQNIVKMECTIKTQNKLTWTEVLFSQAKG